MGSALQCLGLDLGTSSLKAVLVDEAQNVLATTTVPLAISRPAAGWSEQDPQDWWQAACTAIDALRRGAGSLGAVRAIGLSGQMHGLVLLDAQGEPLRPAILWDDLRAAPEAAELGEAHPEFAAIGGAAMSPSFWPAKLLWLARHEPACRAGARLLLAPKDYLRLRLTGAACTDPCDAAGTLLFDSHRRGWSPDLLALCDVRPEQLARIVEGSSTAGTISAGVASRWGLAGDVLVAGGAGDAAAAAIGLGAVGDGDAVISLGTSAQVFVSTGGFRPVPRGIEVGGVQAFAHALPGRWFQSAAVLNGAGALAWAGRLLGASDLEALLEAAEHRAPGPGEASGRPLFLPYLAGERTPYNDPHATGVLFGLSPASDAAAVARAVLEGVAFSLADALAALASCGTRVTEASLVGGGARSRFWTRVIADVLGIALLRHEAGPAGAALGAARLAHLSLGEASEAVVCRQPAILDRTVPDPDRHRLYRQELTRYRELYRALRPEFARASGSRGDATAALPRG